MFLKNYRYKYQPHIHQKCYSNDPFFHFRNKGMSLSSSVSFRQGANVEFAGPAFVSTGDAKSGHDEVSSIDNYIYCKNMVAFLTFQKQLINLN